MGCNAVILYCLTRQHDIGCYSLYSCCTAAARRYLTAYTGLLTPCRYGLRRTLTAGAALRQNVLFSPRRYRQRRYQRAVAVRTRNS